jgi:ABC-type sugar transport system substrate-binding protein
MGDPRKRGVGYIGLDNFKGGRLAANFIGKALESRQNPNVLIKKVQSTVKKLRWRSHSPKYITTCKAGGFLSFEEIAKLQFCNFYR